MAASIFKRNKTWYLDWTDTATGKRHRPRLGSEPDFTQGDAERVLAIVRGELAAGNPVLRLIRPRSSIRWGEFAERYLEWHAAQYPASHWRIGLIFDKQFSSWALRHLDAIDLAFIETWLAQRKRQVAPTTAAKELRTLKAALNKAVEWGLLPSNVVARVKAPRDLHDEPVVFYSKAELELIYAAASKRNAAIWKLFANTGLRRAEALHLLWSDITPRALTIRSLDAARTKSGKWRHVPVSPGAAEALQVLRVARRSNDGDQRVLPVITAHALTRQFQRDLRKAGLKGNLHQLRHTFASHLVMAGRPLYEAKELLGHASIETTEIYAHLAPEHLQAAVSGLNL